MIGEGFLPRLPEHQSAAGALLARVVEVFQISGSAYFKGRVAQISG
jgi:hypothetical protein